MFQDEAGFGRINKPRQCWCPKGVRPVTPCQHVREYRYAYGAVSPEDGESFFLILPRADTNCMNVFLEELGKKFSEDAILLITDNASWHTAKNLKIPQNIHIFRLPPYTPELNPIEQIWKEIRKIGFKNELFKTLDKVIDRLCHTINNLSKYTIKSIIGRQWILQMF